MMMERKIKVKSFNCHITCQICKGYLVDATTVTECLHTFCKSCLVKHLEENNTCAACHQVIHQSHPLQYISFDRTMQDIVYKLVPNLQELEMKRERDFYRSKGLPYPKDIPLLTGELEEEKPIPELTTDQDFRRKDEQVNVDLECKSGGLKMLKKKHIRLSSHATVTTLKKFIALKVLDSADKYQGIEILCNNELLGKDHTLKFVYVTRWRSFPPPLRLQYRPTLLFPDNFL